MVEFLPKSIKKKKKKKEKQYPVGKTKFITHEYLKQTEDRRCAVWMFN
jgi:hypothetical protein